MGIKEYECPLLNKTIDEGYCYDINMVIMKIATEDMIDDTIDREKAKEICGKCKNRPV